MSMFLKTVIAGAAIALIPLAAQATETVSIVSFAVNQAGANLTYKNNGAAGWTLSTVSPKKVLVTLEDFDGGFVSGAAAKWSFTGTGTSFAVSTGGGLYSQAFTGGSLSFTAVNAINIGTSVIAAGGNILTLNFTGGELSAIVPGTSGGAQVTLPGSSFTNVSSGFLAFPPITLTDFSLSLGNVRPGFCFTTCNVAATENSRFANFTATSTGSFTATVPEPSSWALLLLGFGMVGFAARRRTVSVAA